MKRLLSTFVLAALMLAGCNQASTTATNTDSVSKDSVAQGTKAKMAAAQPAAPLVYKTLNGVDRKDALDWIANYQKAIRTPLFAQVKAVSYFLNKDMVTKIAALLATEANSAGAHKTDGIRIYFAKKSVTDPETILLLVSTIDSANTNFTHHDYYGHSAPVLFDPHQTDLNIKVDGAGSNSGAVLYTPCSDCSDIDPTCVSVNYPNALLRSYAEKMIHKFNGIRMNTDAVWFPTSLFKTISTEAAFNGMRIYLGTYPDNLYGPGKVGRNTVVLTTVDNAGKDYFYCDTAINRFEKIGKKVIRYRTGPTQNNGSLCPNNCN